MLEDGNHAVATQSNSACSPSGQHVNLILLYALCIFLLIHFLIYLVSLLLFSRLFLPVSVSFPSFSFSTFSLLFPFHYFFPSSSNLFQCPVQSKCESVKKYVQNIPIQFCYCIKTQEDCNWFHFFFCVKKNSLCK